MQNNQLNVLIVEDDNAIREVICDLLMLEGHKVTSSANGKDALKILAENEPDLVISDVMMPVMDGHTLLEKYKALPESTNIPFLFLTALADKKSIREGMKLGADDYLTKPFSRIELIEAINTQMTKFSQRNGIMEKEVSKKYRSREKLTEKEMNSLITELHHRVKHNLAVITSFIELGEMSGDQRFMRTIKQRIMVIATVQEEAYSKELVTRVHLSEAIKGVLNKIFDSPEIRFHEVQEDKQIEIEISVSAGLLIFELLSLMTGSDSPIDHHSVDILLNYESDKVFIEITTNNSDFSLNTNDSICYTLIDCYVQQLDGSISETSVKEGKKVSIVFEAV